VLGVGMSYTSNCSITFDAGALPVLVQMLGSRDPDERMWVASLPGLLQVYRTVPAICEGPRRVPLMQR
jgi:hypothetical protein